MISFKGFPRKDGIFGSRNHLAILPSVVCVNEIVTAIVNQTQNTRGFLHHQGCCQLSPDLERVTDTLISLGKNPNAGAVLIVSLGCEGVDTERLVSSIADSGKPVEIIVFHELGGTSRTIQRGIDLAQKMIQDISLQERTSVPLSHFNMGIKCGASDTTSGITSNPVIGYVADRVIEEGGSVIFGETTEFIGAEHILERRAVNLQVASQIRKIVQKMETRAKSIGVDMRSGQPTPGNIKGGLSSIEEKSLGAIIKSGTKPIEGVLHYSEIPPYPGLWIKDCPGREIEVLTAMAASGSQGILFSTGLGAPQGFPIVPVLKVCGNPSTCKRLFFDMDINAGKIIEGSSSIEEVGEETFKRLLEVLSGGVTKGEAINYIVSMDIHVQGPVL